MAYHRACLEEYAAHQRFLALQFEYIARHNEWRAADTRKQIAATAYQHEARAEQDAHAETCRR